MGRGARAGAADTIVALASAAGAGERAVLRLSGPQARELAQGACRRLGKPLVLGSRGRIDCRLHDGVGEQPAQILWMPGPGSYTREDVVELHLPGNPHLARAALERFLALGARQAGRGEFTRRAFENGRMDLTQAEGVLALVHASNRAERRAATALLMGGLEQRLAQLRSTIERLRALAEASLDFDEADTGHVPSEELLALAAEATSGLEEALGWEEARAPASSLPRVVLAGPPNAGKSSLFNRLAGGEQRAMVAPIAGSTRDVLASSWSLPGGEVRLEDSAGRQELGGLGAANPADAGAQQLAERAATGADLVLWVVSALEPVAPPKEPRPDLLVWNQVDRAGTKRLPGTGDAFGLPVVATSALDGRGLEELQRVVAQRLGLAVSPGDALASAGPSEVGPHEAQEVDRSGATTAELSARHRAALREAAQDLAEATEGLRAGVPLDLVAETLRSATEGLDAIHGRTTPEDLLSRIFASFCIGK